MHIRRYLGILLLVFCSSFSISCEKDEETFVDLDSNVEEVVIGDNEKVLENDDGTMVNEKESTEDENGVTGEDEEILLKISKYMNQAQRKGSLQGADCYGDYLFQFQDCNANIYIYNLKEKTHFETVAMQPVKNNHCNNVSFSNIFYSEEDEFPLLYVSGSQSGTYNHVQVYRISRTDSIFTIDQIQEIILPESNSINNLYWTGVILDNDNGYMYIYGNHNGAQIAKFFIPNIYTPLVTLKDNDIIDQYTLSKFTHQQGAVIKDNLLYVFDGVPAWGDTNYLRIIDLKQKKGAFAINITEKGLRAEPEGAFFFNDELYCATNSSGIYKVELNMDYLTGIVPIFYDKP